MIRDGNLKNVLRYQVNDKSVRFGSNRQYDRLHNLEKQPKIVKFAEIVTKEKAAEQQIDNFSYAEGTDPFAIEADQKIRAYAKEKGVSYTQAFDAIYK